MNDKYKSISTREDYSQLLYSGLFFEIYPELTGIWEDDKKIILDDEITSKCSMCKDTGYKGIFHPRTLDLTTIECECRKKTKISKQKVEDILNYIKMINISDLEKLDLSEFDISKSSISIEDFKFTGLNNFDYIKCLLKE